MRTAQQSLLAIHPSLSIGYFGHRRSGKAQVYRRARLSSESGPLLAPQLGVHSHSSSELDWGYAGSGPDQLSLAILIDYLGDVTEAEDLYQDFKSIVVAHLPEEEWTLSSEEIRAALKGIRAQRALRFTVPF